MSIKINPIMTAAGYAPAKRVAEVLNKSLQTIHRMVDDGDITGTKEGRVLYVLIASVVSFYADNAPMRAAAETLRTPEAPVPKKKRTATAPSLK